MKIGFATRDFTPKRPALIQGQKYIRIGRTAHDPLTVTAMALDGPQRVLWISCDICIIPDFIHALVRARLAKVLPAVPANAVILSATHTHDSLVLGDNHYIHPGGDVMTSAECTEWFVSHVVAAAQAAWKNRRPHTIQHAYGHAVIGHNRRAVYFDGSAQMYGKTDRPDFSHIEGDEDHGVDMLFVRRPTGQLAGLVLAIPCPSQVEEHLKEFSADFWHELRQELRRRHGRNLFVVGVCTAAGDQSPHFLLNAKIEAEMRRRRGLTQRQEIARRIADAVTSALACTPPSKKRTVFAHRCRRLSLTHWRITKAQRDWAAAEYRRCQQEGGDLKLWWPARNRQVVLDFDQRRQLPRIPVELHFLRFGDVAFVTNPFELFLDYAHRIKGRSVAPHTVAVQLTSGSKMYLPTERATLGGHYSALPAVSQVGHHGGQELVEATLTGIRSMFA